MSLLKISLVSIFSFCFFIGFAQKHAEKGGYCLMRVFDCNKNISAGSYYVNSSIIITFENGEQETTEMPPFTEKNEPLGLKLVVEKLNYLKEKGYMLMSSSTSGEQGTIIMDYVFLKQF